LVLLIITTEEADHAKYRYSSLTRTKLAHRHTLAGDRFALGSVFFVFNMGEELSLSMPETVNKMVIAVERTTVGQSMISAPRSPVAMELQRHNDQFYSFAKSQFYVC
jgi:hypothetical protein